MVVTFHADVPPNPAFYLPWIESPPNEVFWGGVDPDFDALEATEARYVTVNTLDKTSYHACATQGSGDYL